MKIIAETDREKLQSFILRRKELAANVENPVREIIESVRKYGDRAVLEFTEKFDSVRLDAKDIQVREAEIKEAYGKISKEQLAALRKARERIGNFARAEMPREWIKGFGKGIKAGHIVRAIDSVGVYVPGGKYPLPSSVLMNAVPAKVAGVKEVIMCSPPNSEGKINPAILVAADICGIAKIFKVGGAQAIAAMALGTKTIPKVEKIAGPGNIYVSTAKKMLFGEVAIDFFAGPSEVMIIAEKGNPQWIAIDMLAQAEHDENAYCILLTTSKELAEKVQQEIVGELKELATREIAGKAIEKNCAIILVKSIDEAFEIANEFAPEHLEIFSNDRRLLKKVRNAGAVFLGAFSTVSAGDYCAGPNHVLPTSGFAKARAGLSVEDFVKKPAVQIISKDGLRNLGKIIETLASIEGLEAHKLSVKKRLD